MLLKLFQTYDLIGNKIEDKIKWSKSQNAPEFSSETDYESTEITKNIDKNRRDKTTNCCETWVNIIYNEYGISRNNEFVS